MDSSASATIGSNSAHGRDGRFLQIAKKFARYHRAIEFLSIITISLGCSLLVSGVTHPLAFIVAVVFFYASIQGIRLHHESEQVDIDAGIGVRQEYEKALSELSDKDPQDADVPQPSAEMIQKKRDEFLTDKQYIRGSKMCELSCSYIRRLVVCVVFLIGFALWNAMDLGKRNGDADKSINLERMASIGYDSFSSRVFMEFNGDGIVQARRVVRDAQKTSQDTIDSYTLMVRGSALVDLSIPKGTERICDYSVVWRNAGFTSGQRASVLAEQVFTIREDNVAPVVKGPLTILQDESGNVRLSWSASPSLDASKYRLFRKNNMGRTEQVYAMSVGERPPDRVMLEWADRISSATVVVAYGIQVGDETGNWSDIMYSTLKQENIKEGERK